MAWHQIDAKPLFEPMLTQFTDSYMQHYGEIIEGLIEINDTENVWLW